MQLKIQHHTCSCRNLQGVIQCLHAIRRGVGATEDLVPVLLKGSNLPALPEAMLCAMTFGLRLKVQGKGATYTLEGVGPAHRLVAEFEFFVWVQLARQRLLAPHEQHLAERAALAGDIPHRLVALLTINLSR